MEEKRQMRRHWWYMAVCLLAALCLGCTMAVIGERPTPPPATPVNRSESRQMQTDSGTAAERPREGF